MDLRDVLCWTPGEQSVYRGGVGVDPAVTVPLSSWVPFVGSCALRVVARARQPFGSEGFLSRFPGLGLAPSKTQCWGEGYSPRPIFVRNALDQSV